MTLNLLHYMHGIPATLVVGSWGASESHNSAKPRSCKLFFCDHMCRLTIVAHYIVHLVSLTFVAHYVAHLVDFTVPVLHPTPFSILFILLLIHSSLIILL